MDTLNNTVYNRKNRSQSCDILLCQGNSVNYKDNKKSRKVFFLIFNL